MVGRPKIQFTHEDGAAMRPLLQWIIKRRHERDLEGIDADLEAFRRKYPNAVASVRTPPMSEGEMVLQLIREEYARLTAPPEEETS